MNDFNRRIGLKISFLRRQFNMTQEQLSEQTQLSQNFLSQLETGRKTPSILTLHKISGAINIPLSELMKDSESCAKDGNASYKLDKKILSEICALTTQEKKALFASIAGIKNKRKNYSR